MPQNGQIDDGNNEEELTQAKLYADVDPTFLRISNEEFNRISDMIVVHMRAEEEKHGEEENWKGVKQSELVQW